MTNDSLGLGGKVILITGAGNGLGRAYAEALAAQGAKLAVHDGGVLAEEKARDASAAERVAASLRENGAEALAIDRLLGDAASCQAVVEATLDSYGRLDGLIHSAGLVLWRDTASVTQADFDKQNWVATDASFWLAKAALPAMRRQGYGRLLFTSSGWALTPSPGSDELALYCLGKGAQLGLGIALSQGAGHPDIRTNVLAPVAKTRAFRGEVPAGRLLPEHVAGAAAWLVSPACRLTGQIVVARDGTLALQAVATLASQELGEAARDPVAAGRALTAMAASCQET